MQFNFFPSRTLTLYLAKLFIARIASMLAVLILILIALDMLGTSGKILAVESNGQAEILHYMVLRIPQLIARFLPYAVLLATLITLVSLSQNSEVVAMKAAGLSAHQVLAPLLLTAGMVSIGSFFFNDRVVTGVTASLKAWENNEYRPVPTESGLKTNVYFADGSDILMARELYGKGMDTKMRGVVWYSRDPQGLLLQKIEAPSAIYAAPGWRLNDARRFDVSNAESENIDSIIISKGLTPEQVELGGVDPDAQSFTELQGTIAAFERAGKRTSELKAKWWHKLSGPLSAFLMPLLGAVAAFGLARSGQLYVRAIIGMFLGFAYFVVDNAALAMGSFGGYPPFLAAWAPFFLFLLIGETVLIRTEE